MVIGEWMCQGNQMGSLMKQEGYKYGCHQVIRLVEGLLQFCKGEGTIEGKLNTPFTILGILPWSTG